MPEVTAVVVAVLSEVRLAYARAADGQQYAISEQTLGTSWHALSEGQAVELELTPPPVRVLSVSLAYPTRK